MLRARRSWHADRRSHPPQLPTTHFKAVPGDVQGSPDAGMGHHVRKMGVRDAEFGTGLLGSSLLATATHDHTIGRFPHGIRTTGEVRTLSGIRSETAAAAAAAAVAAAAAAANRAPICAGGQ